MGSKIAQSETAIRANAHELRALLDAVAIPEPDSLRNLEEYLIRELQRLKKTRLYPQWETSQHSSASLDSAQATADDVDATDTQPEGESQTVQNDGTEYGTATREWARFISDVQAAAEHIWRDEFKQDASDKASRERLQGHQFALRRRAVSLGRIAGQITGDPIEQLRQLEWLVGYARALKLLEVEARLYQERMRSNFQFYVRPRADAQDGAARARGSPITAINSIMNTHHNTMHKWDRELSKVAGKHLFQLQQSDAQRLRILSKEFGPEGVKPDELGWPTEASRVGNKLRYEYFDALSSVARRSNWPLAVWLLLFKVSSGYGLRPLRFARLTLGAVGTFTAFFFASDLFLSGAQARQACGIYHVVWGWPDILNTLGQHIYIALTTMTTLGADPKPCGLGADVLLTAAAVTGYFLLAMLAALLVQQMTEAGR